MQVAEGTLGTPFTQRPWGPEIWGITDIYYWYRLEDETIDAGRFVLARSIDFLTGSKRMESCLSRHT